MLPSRATKASMRLSRSAAKRWERRGVAARHSGVGKRTSAGEAGDSLRWAYRKRGLVKVGPGGRKISVIADGHWFQTGFFRRIPEGCRQRPRALARVGHAEIVDL